MGDLLRAVLDEPDNLEVRLAYADWLQTRGDPRGTFITLHIQGDPGAEQLLKRYRKEWTAFLLPAVKRGYRFINGFIERITLNAKYLQHLSGFFEHTPLREVRFRDLGGSAEQLATMEDCTRHLTWLDLKQGHVSGQGFASLIGGRWDCLWRLWLPSNAIGNRGLNALVQAKLPRLQSLNLHGTRLNDASLELLAGWSQLASLHELNLRGNNVTDRAVAGLCREPHSAALRRLGLPVVGTETAAALLARPPHSLELLEVTSVSQTSIGQALQEHFGPAYHLNPEYWSPFDLDWP